MEFFEFESLPVQIEVRDLLSSRYTESLQGLQQSCALEGPVLKPDTWDKRVEGIDTIVDTLGRLIRLRSDGGQEPPHKGWVLVLRDGSCESGYGWTLYGFSETKLPEVRTLE